ncbi:hypothetical protein EXIGLDRAFT_734581 [Exidia glandulosa HHB12029]|uniref:Uncharacterized protein n=1 Tax=Exidia glandulosa HHB12029 TaxID=1314781 RepID=A0A165PP33_EXIGL|nr:hypothetical protein EXIGLDRAFT_734581 [Exidia glandulosa HHB12029]
MGAPLQTRNHILVEYLEFERYRSTLRNASLQVSLTDLLGTREGIAAIAKFIQRSGAFARPATLDVRDHDD